MAGKRRYTREQREAAFHVLQEFYIDRYNQGDHPLDMGGQQYHPGVADMACRIHELETLKKLQLEAKDQWLGVECKRIGVEGMFDETHEAEPFYLKNTRAELAEQLLQEYRAKHEGCREYVASGNYDDPKGLIIDPSCDLCKRVDCLYPKPIPQKGGA